MKLKRAPAVTLDLPIEEGVHGARQNVASRAGRGVGRACFPVSVRQKRSFPSAVGSGGSGGYNKLAYVTPQDIPVHEICLTLVPLLVELLM